MNPSLYRVVANQMIEFRMYEEAASVYRQARVATGTQDLFGEDLAVIYGALQQYAAAVKEYVMLVKRNPMQLPLAQAKIASFTTTDQARQAALTVVQDAVRDDAENPSLRMLLASIAIEARQYDVALREVRLVDGLKNAQGGELYSFAQKALQDGAYDIADQAYQDIIERYSGIPLIPYAKLGRIRTAEERLSASDTSTLLASDERLVTSRTAIPWPVRESASGWAEVIAMYERLAAEYPRSTIAAQSQFRVGIIAFEKLFDLDRALEAFRLVEGMREGGDLTVHAKLQSARIMTAQNRLEQARAAYGPLQKVALASVRDAAVFELAELDYYETRFDTAAAVFKGLGGDVRNDLANDALKYLYFIQENASSTRAALVAFARADLLVRQRKYSEALQRFKDTWRAFPVALLSDVAALRVGELELAVGQTDSAFATFRFIADTMETSILRDRALLLMAEAQERLRRDRVRALAAYEELLERFPASIYAELSRQRIRVLRGDAL
jgi:TolA-binding protein